MGAGLRARAPPARRQAAPRVRSGLCHSLVNLHRPHVKKLAALLGADNVEAVLRDGSTEILPPARRFGHEKEPVRLEHSPRLLQVLGPVAAYKRERRRRRQASHPQGGVCHVTSLGTQEHSYTLMEMLGILDTDLVIDNLLKREEESRCRGRL